MTKPITSVAAMMLCEEGAFELKDPVARFIPAFADTRVWHGGNALKPVTVPAGRADAHLAPAHPHRRAHVRLPLRAPGRRACTASRGFEWGAPAGLDLAGVLRRVGRAAAAVRARQRVELLASPPTCSAASSRSSPASRSTRSSRSASSSPLGMTTPRFALATATPTGSPRSTRPTRAGMAARNEVLGGGARAAGVPLRRRRAGLDRGRLPALQRDAARRRRAGRRPPARAAYAALHGAATTCPAAPSSRRSRGQLVLRDARSTASASGSGSASCSDPAAGKVAELVGELAWGGAGQHGVLGRPARGRITAHLLHPAAAVEHLPAMRPQLRQLVYQALVD